MELIVEEVAQICEPKLLLQYFQSLKQRQSVLRLNHGNDGTSEVIETTEMMECARTGYVWTPMRAGLMYRVSPLVLYLFHVLFYFFYASLGGG